MRPCSVPSPCYGGTRWLGTLSTLAASSRNSWGVRSGRTSQLAACWPPNSHTRSVTSWSRPAVACEKKKYAKYYFCKTHAHHAWRLPQLRLGHTRWPWWFFWTTLLTSAGRVCTSWYFCPIRSTDRGRTVSSCRIGESTSISRSVGRSRRTPRTKLCAEIKSWNVLLCQTRVIDYHPDETERIILIIIKIRWYNVIGMK